MEIEKVICSKCGKEYPATTDYFYKRTDNGKLYSWCKECQRNRKAGNLILNSLNIEEKELKSNDIIKRNEMNKIYKETGEGEKKTVAILSDLHIGNENCREDLVLKSVETCESEDIYEVWLGGDLIEYVNKTAVGTQTIPIKKQIDRIVEILTPIQHKITKIIYGNHEQRAMRNHDLEPTELIAHRLGVIDAYTGSYVDSGIYNGFKYYFEHPLRGGANTTSYLCGTFAKRMTLNHDAEIFIFPHFHKHTVTKINKIGIDGITRIPTWFVYEGGYVEYWNSFGHTAHAEVSELGSYKITFDSNIHKLVIEEL